ncbi:pilus assembly PilX family protein [Ideonella sp. BN130291]|uniref:pilus assembly PilX family protein n=1 Tax=Ideonella sp. BN130291 TaxID=3112940 RepID=UPI002E27732D|nr:PilX N-terminal domain-containing pilus assembly protein [Ideonella sp. BN130291]
MARLCPARQQGAASLVVVMLLLFTMMLTAAYASRSLVVEQKNAANQLRATQALEAAEAGLEWGLAQLNAGHVDEQCSATEASGSLSFLERVLRVADRDSGRFDEHADATQTGAPACVRDPAGQWQCTCPSAGSRRPGVQPGTHATPAFQLHFQGVAPPAGAASAPSLVQITAQGCARAGASMACEPSAATDVALAVAQVQAALLPALATPPAATLTASGSIRTGTAAVGLYNTDARGSGLAVHAGASVQAEGARVAGPPGAMSAVLANDSALAARSFERLMLSHLGVPKDSYGQLPSVRTLQCAGDCTAAVQAAVRSGIRQLWIVGDATLADVELGTTAAPVVLVVDGRLSLSAGVRITGFMLARSLQWDHGASGSAWLRGAAMVAGDAQLSGTPDLMYDAAVLHTLNRLTGSFVKVPGSWKDAS